MAKSKKAPAKKVPPHPAEDAKVFFKPNIVLLAIAQLLSDPDYQRGVLGHHNRIAKSLNADAFMVPLVGERPSGEKFVIDGLQRITALREAGYTHVWCILIKSTGQAHEAAVFDLVNGLRVGLNPRALFKARLTAGDPTVNKIYTAARDAGFTVLLHKNGVSSDTTDRVRSWTLTCHGTLMQIVLRRFTDTCKFKDAITLVEYTLTTLAYVWKDDPLRTKADIVGGLAMWLVWENTKQPVNFKKLYSVLDATSPQAIIKQADLVIGDRLSKIATVIDKLYAKGK